MDTKNFGYYLINNIRHLKNIHPYLAKYIKYSIDNKFMDKFFIPHN